MRFNQLRRSIEGISQKMLSQVLKSLERDGLIRRRAIATVPVTVEYSITPLGTTLAAAVDPLRDWAESHLKEVLASQTALRHPASAASGLKDVVRKKAGLELTGFGKFDLDPQFDLGQDRVEAGVAG